MHAMMSSAVGIKNASNVLRSGVQLYSVLQRKINVRRAGIQLSLPYNELLPSSQRVLARRSSWCPQQHVC